MEDSVRKIIASVKDWKELAQFEANVRDRGRLDEEMIAAIEEQSSRLGRELLARRTGIDLTNLSPAESKIVGAIGRYVAVKKSQGAGAEYTFRQVQTHGLLGAAESAVSRSAPTQGFQTLVEEHLSEISYERIIVDHPEEFGDRAIWFARRALNLENAAPRPPALSDGSTQTRTQTLITWIKDATSRNGGIIPVFSNEDVARALGLDDMQKFGRVLGNIQSRVDFACFSVGLPPLGLAADKPFEGAWATEDRDWAYPVATMRRAAQGRRWSADDFDQVVRETERLPGQAHKLWRDALKDREGVVRAWAFGLEAETPPEAVRSGEQVPEQPEPAPMDEAEKTARNPPWSRDELILALDLYMRCREQPIAKDADEVIELSEVLNALGLALGQRESSTYRNGNGVYMKLMNFRRVDPAFAAEGKSGLSRGNKDEERVWTQFAGDVEELARVAKLIRNGIAEHGATGSLRGPDEPGLEEAEEGQVLTRLHRYRERDRRLVVEAKALAMKKYGRLFCEACTFDFSKRYGQAGEGIIDVHHGRPVHTLQPGEKTKVSELILLCSNCHRLVHSRRRWLTIEEVRLALADGEMVGTDASSSRTS